MQESAAQPTDIIHESIITPKQYLILLLCMLASMIEGFDIVVIAYTAPAISQDWGITTNELGIVFSAGVFGMTLGAMLLAWMADRYGRRLVVSGALLVAGVATSGVTYVDTVNQLAILRVVAGLALGVMVATLPALVGEFSPRKHRTFIIAILIASANIGGFAGGQILAAVIADVGWKNIFLGAGLMTIALGVLVLLWVPESIAYTIRRNAAHALDVVNRTLTSIGQQVITQLPAIPEESRNESATVISLLTPARRRATLLCWAAFFMSFLVVYFVSSWMPQVLTGAGLSQQQAIQGATALPLGAILGNMLIGWLATKWGLNKPIVIAFLTGTVFMVCMSAILPGIENVVFTLIWVMLFVIGVTVLGAFGNLYNVALALYPVQIRSTGLGWAAGLGRAGAVISPTLAGVMMGVGMSMPSIFLFFALPAFLAGVAVAFMRIRES